MHLTPLPLYVGFPLPGMFFLFVSLFLRPTLYVRALRSIPYLPEQEELLLTLFPETSFTALVRIL